MSKLNKFNSLCKEELKNAFSTIKNYALLIVDEKDKNAINEYEYTTLDAGIDFICNLLKKDEDEIILPNKNGKKTATGKRFSTSGTSTGKKLMLKKLIVYSVENKSGKTRKCSIKKGHCDPMLEETYKNRVSVFQSVLRGVVYKTSREPAYDESEVYTAAEEYTVAYNKAFGTTFAPYHSKKQVKKH